MYVCVLEWEMHVDAQGNRSGGAGLICMSTSIQVNVLYSSVCKSLIGQANMRPYKNVYMCVLGLLVAKSSVITKRVCDVPLMNMS